jgi:hypothetical protein
MRTTILGVLTIISGITFAGISFIKTGSFDISALILSLTSGVGLIKAADAVK